MDQNLYNNCYSCSHAAYILSVAIVLKVVIQYNKLTVKPQHAFHYDYGRETKNNSYFFPMV